MTETNLDASINDAEVCSDDWTLLRHDRGAGAGGGVLLLARPHFTLERVQQFERNTDWYEILWARFAIDGQYVYVAVVYIRPNSKHESYLDLFENIESVCTNRETSKILILGDLNLNSAGVETLNYYRCFLSMCNLCEYNSVNNMRDSVLDVVLTSPERSGAVSVRRVDAGEELTKIDGYHPPLLVHVGYTLSKKNLNNIKLEQYPERNYSSSTKNTAHAAINSLISLPTITTNMYKVRSNNRATDPTSLRGSKDVSSAKSDALIDKVKALEINDQKSLERVIYFIFEKAIGDQDISEACAYMCHRLYRLKVPADNATSPYQCVNFRALIIIRCQTEFMTEKINEAVIKLEEELNECTDPVKQKELTLMLAEEKRKMRMRSVGNVRFIGELYKQQMLTSKIMVYCMNHLVDKEEEKLECLCVLLTTIGEQLEGEVREQVDAVFKKMQDIVDHKLSEISGRVRCMIQDVIALRRRRWDKSAVDSQPKMRGQIQEEPEQHLDKLQHVVSDLIKFLKTG